jgi:hypothetical protein
VLIFADDLVIPKEKEGSMQKSLYKSQKLSNIYNFKISATKNLLLFKENSKLYIKQP